MSFAAAFVKTAQRVLPSPFTIAILLTVATYVLALLLTTPQTEQPHALELLLFWQGGFFNFLTFAMQMALILVLGHVLALTRPAEALLRRLVRFCTTTAQAAFWVTLTTVLVGLFNWGLALILGAIFARKVGEYAAERNAPLNYPLVGAAGYTGLMVWHGGLSGSAPLKVAEAGHEFADQMGVLPFSETIFSGPNLLCMALLLTVLPTAMYLLGRRTQAEAVPELAPAPDLSDLVDQAPEGAERLDHAPAFAYVLGGLMVFLELYQAIGVPMSAGEGFDWSFSFINPNFLIFLLFGLAVLLHGSFHRFQRAVAQGIGGTTGILIQFPLYAGIIGIMIQSGLVNVLSEGFVAISNPTTFPLFTFLSAGLVNVFVPSGGGQWMVQGPILIEASQALGVPMERSVLALCYGDQITNMLQPFWALPLLGITGLKAKEILPYTLFLLLVGSVIFCGILLLT